MKRWWPGGAMFIVAIVIFLSLFFRSRMAGIDPSTAQADKVRAIAVKQGIFTAKDIAHLPDLMEGNARPLSNKEFSWILMHLDKAKAPPSTNRPMVVSSMLEELEHARLSQNQISQTQAAALPLLSENDEVFPIGLIQSSACLWYVRHPYLAADKKLLALQNSPHPYVSYDATRALAHAGFDVKVPPNPGTLGIDAH